jgi:CubicO group peptidase (beta-lactamase class C family)
MEDQLFRQNDPSHRWGLWRSLLLSCLVVSCGDGGSSNGNGGSSDGGQGDLGGESSTTPQVSECNGVTLPPRALGAPGPYAIGPEAAGLEPYWPTDDWRSRDPASLGFDVAKLQTALAYTTPYANTQALLVIRHGYIAAEQYLGTFTATTRHESYSMAKSFSGALTGIAIDEGVVSGVDQRVCESYDEWDCDDATDARSRITIAHVLRLATGLAWQEDWRSTATGPNDAYNANLLDYTLSRPSVEEPGLRQRYSTGDPSLLSGILQKATGMTAYDYAQKKLFGPLGISGIRWNSDSKGRTTTYAGLQATLREFAKFGYLYLQRGRWDGAQVVPSAWVDRSTRAVRPCEDWYDYLWHINLPVRLGTQDPACGGIFCAPTEFANLPPDAYLAEGINGQFIFMIPSSDLIVARLANDSPGSEHWDDYTRAFMGLMLDAIL